jgi:hypothetical protein
VNCGLQFRERAVKVQEWILEKLEEHPEIKSNKRKRAIGRNNSGKKGK